MTPRDVRLHLAFLAVVTLVTAYFSYAYFHIDEYFQVLELVRYKNGDVGDPLAWEIVEHLRPWLQPALYYGLVRLFRLHDAFTIAFVLRLVTGLANVGAIALLLRTTLPWLPDDGAKRLHLRLLTGLGFLPYLFVRTSSESASMAALTTAFALLLRDATPGAPWRLAVTPARAAIAGLLLGAAFELRFQTAFASAGLLAWLAWQSRQRARALLPIAGGGVLALVLGALADRWGYGRWELTPWTYFKANILEGAAGTFGTEPPFAYLWMSPANVFAPVVVALIIAVAIAWRRELRHPLTWATLPFVVVHCLIGHKEERFLFPVVPLVIALVAFARVRIPAWRFLVAWSFAGMLLLAFFPLGWHTHVRFTRFVHEHVGDDFHAAASPEIELNFPAFRPRVYDIAKGPEASSREWLVMDRPDFAEAPELEGKYTLVYSELPFGEDPSWRAREMRWVDAYNAHAPPPLRKIYFRSLFRRRP